MLAPGAAFGLSSGDDDIFVTETITPRRPSGAELDVGTQVMRFVRQRFGTDLLYAPGRPTPECGWGRFVIELELTEPSLFLEYRQYEHGEHGRAGRGRRLGPARRSHCQAIGHRRANQAMSLPMPGADRLAARYAG